MLEAAVGHPENSVQALDHLAEGARINLHEQIIRTVDGPGGNLNVFAEIFIEAAVEKNVLIVPGKVFSAHDTHFRLSFAASDEHLATGISVLNELAERFSN